jgi:hypothetical protein
MQLRLLAIEVERFSHAGLCVVLDRWTTLDLEDLAPETRAALVKYTGRFIKIHPHDVDKLAELGLVLNDGKLLELVAETAPGADSGIVTPAATPAAIASVGRGGAGGESRRARRE